MKKIIVFLFVFFSTNLWCQYSGITYFPKEKSFMVSTENLGNSNFGIHAGGGYNMWMVSYPVSSFNPSPYLNRFGINYGFLHCGLVLGGGIKFNTLTYLDPKITPEMWIKLQPIKLITENKNSFDVSITYSISKESFLGFGIAIPMQYR